MKREEILSKIKELDENDIYPYLYSAITDGSEHSEQWLNSLEDKNIKTETELIAEIEIFQK